MLLPSPAAAWTTALLLSGLGSCRPRVQEDCSRPAIGPNSYMIGLKADQPKGVLDSHLAFVKALPSSSVENVMDFGKVQGYAGTFGSEALAAIRQRPEVRSVEKERLVTKDEIKISTRKRGATRRGLKNEGKVTQAESPWSLAMISWLQGPVPDDHDYTYAASAGEGTWAYVIDGAVDVDHPDFGGRASIGAYCGGVGPCSVGDEMPALEPDEHGTDIAGVIGSETYGVAKKTNIVSVVLPDTCGNILLSNIRKAVLWAWQDIIDKKRLNKSVIHMSVGSDCPDHTFEACRQTMSQYAEWEKHIVEAWDMVAKDVLIVASSGNQGLPAAWSSNGHKSILTVGAMDNEYKEAAFSNYGIGVDILAPGVDIEVLGSAAGHGATWGSGTSLAAPHVSGVALCLMARRHFDLPARVKDEILKTAAKDVTPLTKDGPSTEGYSFLGRPGMRRPSVTSRRRLRYAFEQRAKPSGARSPPRMNMAPNAPVAPPRNRAGKPAAPPQNPTGTPSAEPQKSPAGTSSAEPQKTPAVTPPEPQRNPKTAPQAPVAPPRNRAGKPAAPQQNPAVTPPEPQRNPAAASPDPPKTPPQGPPGPSIMAPKAQPGSPAARPPPPAKPKPWFRKALSTLSKPFRGRGS